MAKQTEREIRLTASFRDRITTGLTNLRKTLRGTTDDAKKAQRDGGGAVRRFSDELRQSFQRGRESVDRESRTIRDRMRMLAMQAGALRARFATLPGVFRMFAIGLRTLLAPIRAVVSALTSLRFIIGAVVAGLLASRFYRAFRATVDELDKVAKASQQLGIATSELTRLGAAAEFAGIEFNTVVTSTRRMQRRLAEFVNRGGGPAAEAFRRLNINAKDSEGRFRDVTDVLSDIADGLSQIPDQAERLRLAFQIFDTEGGKLLQMMQDGGDAMRAMFDEVERLAPALLDSRVYAQSERLADSFTRIGLAVRGIRAAITQAIGPDIERLLDHLANRIADFGRRVRNVLAGLREMFRYDGEIGQQLRQDMELLLVRLGHQVIHFTTVMVRLAVSSAINTIRSLIPVLVPELISIFGRIAFEVVAAIGEGVMRFIIEKYSQRIDFLIRQMNRIPGVAIAAVPTEEILSEFSTLTQEGKLAIGEFLQWVGIVDTESSTLAERIRQAAATAKDATVGEMDDVRLAFAGLMGALSDSLDRLAESGRQALGEIGDAVEGTGKQTEKTQSLWQEFFGGLQNGVSDSVKSLQKMADVGRTIGASIGEALTKGIGEAIGDIVIRAESATEVFRNLAASVLEYISQIIMQAAITRALGATAFGQFLGFNGGGPIERNSGGLIPGRGPNRDSVAAMLTPGEFVIRRDAVDSYGAGLLHAINQQLVPPGLLRMLAARRGASAAAGRVGFNTGGAVGSSAPPQAAAAPAVAVIAPTGEAFRRLLEGGRNEMLDFLSRNGFQPA